MNINVIANAASYSTPSNDTLSDKATNTYTVIFNSNGGLEIANMSVEYNANAAPPSDLSRTGYVFEGWYTDNTTFENQFDFTNTDITGDITLFAKWKIERYTATFNSQGGSGVIRKLVEYDSTITTPTAPTMPGYKFVGWYKEANYLNTWNFIEDKVTTNTTLYAKWTLVAAPPTPQNLKATIASFTSIKLTWVSVLGANGYEIYKSTSINGPYTLLTRTTSLYYINSGLTTGKKYYYKIRSYRNDETKILYSNWTGVASGVTTKIVFNSLVQPNPVYGKYTGLKVEIRDQSNNSFLIKNPNGSEVWVASNKVSIAANPATNTKYLDKKQLETYVNITSTFVSNTKYFTWVDLNRQRVSIFTGGATHWTLLKTYSCATGNNITPSKRGLFALQNKGYSFTTDGGALVKYWTAYSGNYLLHSTILDSSGKVVIDGTLGKRVSHGCIRMPLDMAKWYYENMPRGSLVWVN
nr:InlB B-repeat-containing protein [Clostridium sp.]